MATIVEEEKKSMLYDHSNAPYDIISSRHLYNLHQQYIDLYDVRSAKEYKLHHICGATHIPNTAKWETFDEEYDCPIVIYGNAKLITNELCYQLYKIAKSQRKHKWFSVFPADYNEFYDKYPFLCESGDSKNDDSSDANDVSVSHPAMIIENKLFLGDQFMANNKHVIKNLNITHILNISKIPSRLEQEIVSKIKYLTVAIEDDSTETISAHFEKAHVFIHDALKQNKHRNSVFVHCQAGVSRSASVIISYLMKYEACSLRKAYLETKRCRPQIAPNYGFYKELVEFEKKLYAKSTAETLEKILGSKKWKVNYLSGHWVMP